MGDYAATCLAVAETVRAATASVVAAGVAEVVLDTDRDAQHEVKPHKSSACAVTVYVQSANEVSLWPAAPGTDRAPTVDIYEDELPLLKSALGDYLAAIIDGKVEWTLRSESADGRFRAWLSDGRCQSHTYNVWPWRRIGRGSGWETFRADPY